MSRAIGVAFECLNSCSRVMRSVIDVSGRLGVTLIQKLPRVLPKPLESHGGQTNGRVTYPTLWRYGKDVKT